MAVGLTQSVLAAASTVPRDWNIHADFKLGAYLQDFEGTAPAWIGSHVPAADNSHVNYNSRANTWFGSNAKVLVLDTGDGVLTNAVAYSDSTAVTFTDNPVYVDMRIKFALQTSAPDTAGAKLAIYASATDKLKVVHNGGTNEYTRANLDTTWHQLTVKMIAGGTFDVLLDDSSVATGLTLIGAPSDNKLNSVSFSGTGSVDELYVSHGNPNYAGVMGAIPTAITGDLDDEASVNNWLAGLIYAGSLTTGTTFPSFTKTQLNNAYLLNALTVTEGAASPPGEATLGIKSFELVDATHMDVTVYLKVGETPKDGKINGRIQLQGEVTKGAGFTPIGSAISPTLMDFDNGTATYTFAIPADPVYRFFKPTIIE